MVRPVLCSAIRLPEGTVPDWLHLLPAGEVRTNDGRGPYRVTNAQALMATSIAAGKLPLDENHSMDLAAPKGGASPARGWFVELQQREDGIWGRVEWTSTGRQIMEDREYSGVSPVILHGADGSIRAILRASLTNTPNITGLTALHSQRPDALDPIDHHVIRSLGLDPVEYARTLHAATASNGVTRHAAEPTAIGVGAPPMDPQSIMRKARALQETFQQAGLPIDLASAISSVMEEEIENSPPAMKPAEIELHAQQLQAMFRKLGMEIDLASAVRALMEPG